MKSISKCNYYFKRLAAFVIDFIIIILINIGLMVFLCFLFRSNFNTTNGNLLIILLVMCAFLGFITFITYFAFWDSYNYRGSVGKKLFRITVVSCDGNQLSLEKSIFRAILKIFSLSFFGYIFILTTQKKQALHDILSKTEVVLKVD